jgi:hypothetical protein
MRRNVGSPCLWSALSEAFKASTVRVLIGRIHEEV